MFKDCISILPNIAVAVSLRRFVKTGQLVHVLGPIQRVDLHAHACPRLCWLGGLGSSGLNQELVLQFWFSIKGYSA